MDTKKQKSNSGENTEASPIKFNGAIGRAFYRCAAPFKAALLFARDAISPIRLRIALISACPALFVFGLLVAIISFAPHSVGNAKDKALSADYDATVAMTGTEMENSGGFVPWFGSTASAGRPHEIDLESASRESLVSVCMDDYSDLEYGVEDERVETLQTALAELGYLNIEETTTFYGPATKQAVSLFQRQLKMEQTGIADETTLTALFSKRARAYCLAEGAEGEDVRRLQRQLADLAYIDKITGYYGDLTIEGVRDFQARNGLAATGVANTETMELLYMPDVVPGENYTYKAHQRAKILTFVDVARQQLGKRYSLGSTGPNYFDCSGLVYYCLRQAGSNRGRLSAHGYSQVSEWEKIPSMNNLEIGDLLFFYGDSRGRVGHVGIYTGGGQMIDASFSKGRIVQRACKTDYWIRHFVFARRPW